MVAFSISTAVSWGDQVCAVKRLNYPRIFGIQTEAPRRGPSTGDQRAAEKCGGLVVKSST